MAIDSGAPMKVPTIEHDAVYQRVLARMRGVELPEDVSIGRYTFVRRLGVGGMGIVYLVRDPELDRLVALKLLHPVLAADARKADAIERRMRREARAMARLDHANVVRVLEVGAHEGRIYLVMEYVEGTTLTRWLEAGRRSWQELVRVFIAAGEGLAAAHDAGLAHCDFKPDNVLIGDGGAVKVTDFGLARALEAATAEVRAATELACVATKGGLESLSTGIVGTPAFMAPELLAGRRGDPLADQFSFCVALYLAIYGELPFRGASIEELRASVGAGLDPAAVRARRVPAALRQILARGLAVDPGSRWSSMSEVLAALRRLLGARQRRRRYAALAVVTLAATALGGFELDARVDHRRRVAACVAEGRQITEVWNDDARARVRDGLLRADVPYARSTLTRALPVLDAYARDWAEARTDACLDAEVHGTWDPEILARSRVCFDDRRMDLEALVAELSRTDAPVGKVTAASSWLRPLRRCREGNGPPLLPTDDAEQTRVVQRALSRAGARAQLGRYEEGLRTARAAREAADALGSPPLSAEAASQEAMLLLSSGDLRAAIPSLESAYFQAAHAHVYEAMLANAVTLVAAMARAGRFEDAVRWSEHARVVVTMLGADGSPLHATLLANLVMVHVERGEPDDGVARGEEALAMLEAQFGPDHPTLGPVLEDLVHAHVAAGDLDAATATAERLRALLERALGPDHPELATVHAALSSVHLAGGELERARSDGERAVALARRRGAKARALAICLGVLAVVERELGALDDARAHLEHALSIWDTSSSPDHPLRADVVAELGRTEALLAARDGEP